MPRSFLSIFKAVLTEPVSFFRNVNEEMYLPAFIFFIKLSLLISLLTTVANYLGIPSNDFSSAYQAQIVTYQLMTTYLIPQLGMFVFLSLD